MFQDGSTLSAKLTTTGRVTGQAHTVRLRLVYYQERFFASRRDGRSDWCRNVLANPEVSVELEGRHFGGRAVLVADEDLRQKISELKYGNQRRLEPRGVIKKWCRRSDSRPNVPFCRFVSGSVPLSIPNTVPIVPVALTVTFCPLTHVGKMSAKLHSWPRYAWPS